MKKQISIIGRGMDPKKHLTLEAIDHLKNADVILGIESEVESWREITDTFQLKTIKVIENLYQNGAKDIDNYQAFINLIEKLTFQYDRIALLIAGHPRLGVTFAKLISDKDSLKSINIFYTVGISSFDVMINDLALDPLEEGTAILDANRILLFNLPIIPSINQFIYHICSVGTCLTNHQNAAQNNHIELLQQYLLKFYKSDKIITLCKASLGKSLQSDYINIQLKDFFKNLEKIDFATSLFIPAELPSSINKDYLKLLRV